MNLVNLSPHQLLPCPCVVYVIVGLTHGGFPLVVSNLKLNALDVDTWRNLEALLVVLFHSSRRVPCGTFWLVHVVSVSRPVAYKWWNSSPTLSHFSYFIL